MANLVKYKNIRECFDEIDNQVYKEVYGGFYESRLRIEIGMWEKGEIIVRVFRGVKTPSYYELEKQTGRDHKALKYWHNLYKQYPDKEKYIREYAEIRATSWTEKALNPKEIKQTKSLPMLPGIYRIIYADPPWKYGDKPPAPKGSGAMEYHYNPMSIEELCSMKLPKIANNAALFLWVTSPLLEECFEVIKCWGFEYKASFIWDKISHNVGHYNSVRHELLLICIKGSCPPDNKVYHDSVVSIKRSRIHSEKPEKFREIIDELYPGGNRIELFARKKVLGWDGWGLEVKNE